MPRISWMLAATAVIALAQPAWADGMPTVRAIDLTRVNEIALREGLLVREIEVPGPGRLHVISEGRLSRSAFLKRANLVAYLVFDRLRLPLEEITFRNWHEGGSQSIVIRHEDHALFLQDRISKAEYERRLAYQETRPQAPVAKRPAPPQPQVQVAAAAEPQAPVEPLRAEVAKAPILPAAPAAPPPPAPRIPALAPPSKPGLAPLFGLGYWLGGSGRAYDAYQLEYGHPMLSLLDLRPSLQILSPFSPANMHAGDAALSGFSLACDVLGTTRHSPSVSGLSFDGGLGARLTSVQDGGWWPSAHVRVGVRWHALTVSMRYPLFRRSGDPTAGWESSVGFSLPIGN